MNELKPFGALLSSNKKRRATILLRHGIKINFVECNKIAL